VKFDSAGSSACTRLERLVVRAIIAILAALRWPALGQAKLKVDQTLCASHGPPAGDRASGGCGGLPRLPPAPHPVLAVLLVQHQPGPVLA
jgi:hypothetical protein